MITGHIDSLGKEFSVDFGGGDKARPRPVEQVAHGLGIVPRHLEDDRIFTSLLAV